MRRSPVAETLMNERIRRFLLVAISGGLIGSIFFVYLHYSETEKLPSFAATTKELPSSFLIGALLGLSLYAFNKRMDLWIPWRKHFAARFISGYVSNVAIALTITLGLALSFISIAEQETFWSGLSPKDEDVLVKIAILLITSVFIYTVIYGMLYSYQHYAVAQIETLRSERKQLELQFEALKGQISPHYLFNSLNTISSLIFKDLPSAEQFIRRLAQTYQYILSTQHKKYVLLKEEVDFVQSYYYLLRIRFQQQLNVEINLPSGIMNTKIPPLTLQMLVENAVKHNTVSNDKKLFIYITAQDNTHLKVINTKTGVLDSVSSFKVGLENIKRRYEFFTDQKIEVRDEDKFTVSLPVLHQKHDTLEHKFSA
jgi:two-component system LytT family sensor kinase